MGKEVKRTSVEIGELQWKRVEDFPENLTVSRSEFELIGEFLRFIRRRERGTFTAELVTHEKRRFVIIDKTDRVKIDLNMVVDDE